MLRIKVDVRTVVPYHDTPLAQCCALPCVDTYYPARNYVRVRIEIVVLFEKKRKKTQREYTYIRGTRDLRGMLGTTYVRTVQQYGGAREWELLSTTTTMAANKSIPQGNHEGTAKSLISFEKLWPILISK